MNYCFILITVAAATINGNALAATQGDFTDSLGEVVAIFKEMHSEVAKKRKAGAANSMTASGCLVQSLIHEGKTFPIGVSYRQLCPHSALNKEVEINEQYPTSCREIQRNGNTISGIYKIQPKNSKKPFMVLCDMETRGGGWTHIQKRFDGSVDFFLEFRDYKFGFGDLGGEFWIGLENIYNMADSEANELLIEIVDRKNVSAYAHYKMFAIGPEPDGYPLNSLRGFSGDAGDSLSPHVGRKFSTKDFDRDDSDGNCAIIRGAWWYKSCYSSNLNSIFINAQLPQHHELGGLQWETFGPINYCHAKSRMLIRPSKS